jgi:hypothetical protein
MNKHVLDLLDLPTPLPRLVTLLLPTLVRRGTSVLTVSASSQRSQLVINVDDDRILDDGPDGVFDVFFYERAEPRVGDLWRWDRRGGVGGRLAEGYDFLSVAGRGKGGVSSVKVG